ncbi:MAG TPA: GNAT family N-acetyltransferase [Gammaproteobacteria bacterium]|nr:GNAT family N-acetyltransferase [Gammaproteobacteria bacterium]
MAHVVESAARVRGASPAVRIVRVTAPDGTALRLLEEYYAAVDCVLRDSPAAIREILDEPGAGMWLAWLGEQAVGCVVVRRLDSIPGAAECKRLYVKPAARGHGIADALMDTLEAHARGQGFKWIYLDTYDDLKPAIALYGKRGYKACERYNNNPQATCFFRKSIHNQS